VSRHIFEVIFDHSADIASGGKYGSTPYASVTQNIKNFVEKKYLPAGVDFKDPAYMPRDDILQIMEHIRTCQNAHGIPHAFRWTSYLSGNTLEDALYTGSEAAATAKRAKHAATQRGRRAQAKKKVTLAKKKRNEELENFTTSEEEENISPSEEDNGSDEDSEQSEVDNLSYTPVRRMPSPATPPANDDEWDAECALDEPVSDVDGQNATPPDNQADDADANGSKAPPTATHTMVNAPKKPAQKHKRNQADDADGEASKELSKRHPLADTALNAPKTPAHKHKPNHASQMPPQRHALRNSAENARKTPGQKGKHSQEEDAESSQRHAMDDAAENATNKRGQNRKRSQEEDAESPQRHAMDDGAVSATKKRGQKRKRSQEEDAESPQRHAMDDAAVSATKKRGPKRKHSQEEDAATCAQIGVDESLEVREMNRICEGIGAKRVRKVKVRES
jgi:hypothetical protein